MGPGAMFVGMMAEVLIPVLLLFPLSYYVMLKRRGRSYGLKRLSAAFFAALLGGGLVYAALCVVLRAGTMAPVPTADLSNILILLVPLLASVLFLWAFKPRPPKG